MFLTSVTALATHPVAALVLPLTDESPKPEDVKAGWTAFAIFIVLIVAVVLLAFSLVKQLRKAQAAKDAGVYGDEPEAKAPAAPADAPENHDQPSS